MKFQQYRGNVFPAFRYMFHVLGEKITFKGIKKW